MRKTRRSRVGILPRINFTVDVLDAETGALLSREEGHNIATTAGLNLLRDLICGDTSDSITHLAAGSSATAANVGQTALVTETIREAITSTTKGSGSVTFQYLMPKTAYNGNTFREAGMLTASVAGTMFNRWVYTAIPKTSAIQILFTLSITFAEV